MTQPPERPAVVRSCLVVEDEPDLREALAEWLGLRGWEVAQAGNLTQARHALASRAFTVLLTDDSLPDGRGIDLVRHVLAYVGPRPRLLLVSGNYTPGFDGAPARNADAYLPKPFTFQQLTAALASLAGPESEKP